MTMAPRSLPRYLSKSSFDFTSTTIGVADKRRRQARRPRARIAGDAHVLRRGHLDREALDRPAATGGAVGFERGIDHAPLRQLIARPFRRGAQRRRAGQPRAVDVAQPAERVHHRGLLKRLRLDLRDYGVVDGFLSEERNGGGERAKPTPQRRECSAGLSAPRDAALKGPRHRRSSAERLDSGSCPDSTCGGAVRASARRRRRSGFRRGDRAAPGQGAIRRRAAPAVRTPS